MNTNGNVNIERSISLQTIRPELQLTTDESQTFEFFQNKVIRPILKFQNELLVASFNESKQFQQFIRKTDKTNKMHFEQGIKEFLKSNNSFRNRIYGFVLGLMTIQEYQEYISEESEYNRRIRSMLVKRVLGQLYSKD